MLDQPKAVTKNHFNPLSPQNATNQELSFQLNDQNQMLCNGKPIASNTSVSDDYYVIRTWKERFFSWPWKPWKSKKWLKRPHFLIFDWGYFCTHETYVQIYNDLWMNRKAQQEQERINNPKPPEVRDPSVAELTLELDKKARDHARRLKEADPVLPPNRKIMLDLSESLETKSESEQK